MEDNITISFIKLGTRIDNGEIAPILPKNNSTLQVVDLKEVWLSQEDMNPDNEKGMDGMIFPFNFDKLYSIDEIKDNNYTGNGTVFIDIDCGPELIDEIFKYIPAINDNMGGSIICAATTRKGLHLILYGGELNAEEYELKTFYYLTSFAWILKEVSGIDLRDVDKALDTCTFTIKQRLFLRFSKNIYWNDNYNNATLNEHQKSRLRKEYKEIYNKKFNKGHLTGADNNNTFKIITNATIIEIKDIDKHEYIEHSMRWSLFDSLCCCFGEDYEELMKQWKRCCSLIEPANHNYRFFLEEPKKNRWFDKWKNNKEIYCNTKLLNEFGYITITNKKYYI